MKKILLSAVLTLLAITGCNKPVDPDNPTSSGKDNTPITLTASTTTPVMDRDHQNDEALTLSWNATTNLGTGARIEYSVLVDLKGGKFETGYEVNLGTNVTSLSLTAMELNTIAKEDFGLENDQTTELDICVYATIKSNEVDDVVSNTVTITVTPFEPKPSALYMIGSATEAGWDLSKAVAMSAIEGEEGGFTWSGELYAGELKFLVNPVDWIPSYNKGDNDETLYYRDHYWDDPDTGEQVDDESLPHVDTPDNKFIIAEQGNYKIVLNIEKLTITITKTGGPKYFSMYVVGSAFEQPQAMFRSGYAFFSSKYFAQAGNFHFNVNSDGSGDSYFAASAGQAITSTAVSQTSNAEWSVNAGEMYNFYLYAREGKEKAFIVPFTPYEQVYIIGSASDAGWDIANALPMTRVDQWTQKWEGSLKAGELKFTCDKSTDWYGAWYLATTVDKVPTGEAEPTLFIDKASDAVATTGIREFDQKWIITDQTAGYYTITLDQKNQTVIIKKN
ncbi:MAG: SusF/SusE family outer membrane protein [Bacteroidales bacterium]|nr:SusF/SusE family outer membrane protein [Bacteroidales bacterium]